MRRRIVRAAVVAAALAASAVAVSPAAQAAPNPGAADCVAAAHLQDASHSGVACGLRSGGRLTPAWTTKLNAAPQYPLLADGKVFVTTSNQGGPYGGSLYALDAATGAVAWGPIPLSGTYYTFNLAYADGRVYVDDFDGDVLAFAAADGRQLWTSPTAYFSGEPVVFGGSLYVQAAGTVYAVDATTGARRWLSRLDGTDGAVAVDSTGVYVSAGCSRYRLSLDTGAVVWSGNNGCTGGGGYTAYLSSGRMFEDGGHYAVRATTGKLLGSYGGAPAFADGIGYFAAGKVLSAQNATTRSIVFTTTLPAAAISHPIVADGVVYIAAGDGKIYALDVATGALLTTTATRTTTVGDLAVGQGRLVARTGTGLVAFR